MYVLLLSYRYPQYLYTVLLNSVISEVNRGVFMVVGVVSWNIVPPIVAGLIIGIYEIILIHRDVQVASHRFGHSIHAIFFAIIACFFTFNVPVFFQLVPAIKSWPILGSEVGVRILIGIIAAIKIHGVSAALKTSGFSSQGMKETWVHSLIVGLLTSAAPYVWPFVAPMLPKWAGGN